MAKRNINTCYDHLRLTPYKGKIKHIANEVRYCIREPNKKSYISIVSDKTESRFLKLWQDNGFEFKKVG